MTSAAEHARLRRSPTDKAKDNDAHKKPIVEKHSDEVDKQEKQQQLPRLNTRQGRPPFKGRNARSFCGKSSHIESYKGVTKCPEKKKRE